MVGRQRVVSCCQRCATAVAKLVCVQFDGEAEFGGAVEHARDLWRTERDRLAVSVDGVGQSARCHLGQQFVADLCDVSIRVIVELRRYSMGGKQRCADINRRCIAE